VGIWSWHEGKWAIGPSCTYNEPLHKSKAKKCKFFCYFGAHYMAPAPSQVSLVGRLDNRTWDTGIARPSSNAVKAQKKGYNWAWETPISGWAGRKGMRCPLLVWHANLLLLETNGQSPLQKGASTQRRGAVDMPNFDMHIEHKNPGGISQNGMLPTYESFVFQSDTPLVFFPQYLMSAHQIPVAYYIV
jgi:hypothetical protein